jgi:Ca2+-binding EF-hand superfamily protein
MMRKKLTADTAFARFLQSVGVRQAGGQLNKKQFREVVKKEGISFNFVQADFIFDKVDSNGDHMIDIQEWLDKFKEDAMNPL